MARRTGMFVLVAVLGAVLVGALAAFAIADSGNRNFKAKRMSASFEVPAVSSNARGSFEATLNSNNNSIAYELSYSGLGSNVTQAHIHFAQTFASGGISVWLCETTTNQSPQASFNTTCPQPPNATTTVTVTGTITANEVLNTPFVAATPTTATQGIAAGEFAEFVAAMRAGLTYANVHSASIPGGEIRGQIRGGGGDDDDDDD